MTYTQRIIISACIFISMIAISWGFNKIFFKNKHTTWQDILSTTLGRVLPYIFLLIGTYIIIHLWSIPEPYYTLTHKALFAMAIIAASFIIASAITASIKIYAKNGQHTIAAMTLTRNMANALILVLGLLVLLSYLGIAIAPMLTAMGIGGIAIALGLQDTLSNVFAGIYIIGAGRMKIGDYIKLTSGEEGYVHDIAWRESRIRTGLDNILTIPNSLIAKVSMTNFSRPSKDVGFFLIIGVDYTSDLAHVEKVTLETARAVMTSVRGGMPHFEPQLRFQQFADSSINLKISLRAHDYSSQSLVTHEFIKKLHQRYNQENIIMPFPTRTIIEKKSI